METTLTLTLLDGTDASLVVAPSGAYLTTATIQHRRCTVAGTHLIDTITRFISANADDRYGRPALPADLHLGDLHATDVARITALLAATTAPSAATPLDYDAIDGEAGPRQTATDRRRQSYGYRLRDLHVRQDHE